MYGHASHVGIMLYSQTSESFGLQSQAVPSLQTSAHSSIPHSGTKLTEIAVMAQVQTSIN